MQIQGSYYFNLKIGEYSDFLKYDDVITFYKEDNCGASGSLFEIAFKTTNSKIKDLFIENNDVIVELGESAEKAETYTCHISEHPNVQTTPDDSVYMISFIATTIPMKFYNNRQSATVTGTSLDMIKDIARKELNTEVKLDTELEPVEATKNWVRSYETGAVAMMEAWLHMNLLKSTPMLWIDDKNVVHMSDIETLKKAGPTHTFVAIRTGDAVTNTTQYHNDFVPTSYKFGTNILTGAKTVANISNVESGDDTVHIPDNETDIASTTVNEDGDSGTKIIENKYQTDNVHSKFMLCYYTNKLRLIRLSSYVGRLECMGFVKKVHPCELINVVGCTETYSGRYIVNTKVVFFTGATPLQTYIYVCRDNQNSIENSDVTPKSKVKIYNQQLTDILQAIRTLRRLAVMGTKYLDGSTKTELLAYLKSFKYNALNSFQVMGVPLNLNSSVELMLSMRNIANSIINNIIDKIIPYPYNLLLHNLILEGLSFKKLLSQLLVKYLPQYLREFYYELLGLLVDLANLADALHKQNSKSLSDYNYTSGGYGSSDSGNTGTNSSNSGAGGNASGTPYNKSEYTPSKGDEDNMSKDTTQENTEKIKTITDEFIDNTDGIDLPIPDIEMTDSDSLLPTEDLKKSIANKVITYLTAQGYLTGVDTDYFLDVLTGAQTLNFNTIKLINGNIGNMLYARYWGTYSGQVTKLGSLSGIMNQVVTVKNVDLTEELFNGDMVTISGTDSSNGTYTVVSVEYDGTNSLVTILEDIATYNDNPLKSYVNISTVDKVEVGLSYGEYTDLSAIYVTGDYTKFATAGSTVRVTNLGIDGSCTVLDSNYDKDTLQTVIYTHKVLIASTATNLQFQIAVETENGTTISKLSNQDITDFFIKNGFKDVYSTIPCTKTINASKGAKVWIAIPAQEEDNVDFYINSTLVEMNVLEDIDLGLYTTGGAQLLYNMYISPDTYNSNNVTLEIRKKTT